MSIDTIVLHVGAGGGPRIPWTSSVVLHRFVWAIKLGVGLGNGHRLDCRRAALVVWLRKLAILFSGSESGALVSSPDEQMLDWLMASVRGGLTPKEVLMWFFPSFKDLLFLMITGIVEEV